MTTNGTDQLQRTPRPRVEAERAQRRRRDDLGFGRMRNLSIHGELDPRYHYRWVKADPGRMYQLTKQDDWDVVDGSEMGRDAKDKGVGTGVERAAGKQTGDRLVLVRKLKEYYDADKAKEQAAIDVTEAAIKRGAVGGANGLLTGKEASKGYVPQGGIVIDAQSKS